MEIPIEKHKFRKTIWNLSNKDCQQTFKINSEKVQMKETWETEGDINAHRFFDIKPTDTPIF